MQKNIGSIDKRMRILLAVILIALQYTNVITGTLGIVLLILAAILLATSFINFCPLYSLFGIKTNKKS